MLPVYKNIEALVLSTGQAVVLGPLDFEVGVELHDHSLLLVARAPDCRGHHKTTLDRVGLDLRGDK